MNSITPFDNNPINMIWDRMTPSQFDQLWNVHQASPVSPSVFGNLPTPMNLPSFNEVSPITPSILEYDPEEQDEVVCTGEYKNDDPDVEFVLEIRAPKRRKI